MRYERKAHLGRLLHLAHFGGVDQKVVLNKLNVSVPDSLTNALMAPNALLQRAEGAGEQHAISSCSCCSSSAGRAGEHRPNRRLRSKAKRKGGAQKQRLQYCRINGATLAASTMAIAETCSVTSITSRHTPPHLTRRIMQLAAAPQLGGKCGHTRAP